MFAATQLVPAITKRGLRTIGIAIRADGHIMTMITKKVADNDDDDDCVNADDDDDDDCINADDEDDDDDDDDDSGGPGCVARCVAPTVAPMTKPAQAANITTIIIISIEIDFLGTR